MKRLIIVGIVIVGSFQYIKWEPSTSDIAKEMGFGEQLSYNGQAFYSDWTDDLKSISGHVRRIDRHYDKNIPIITYDLVITSGDFSDPDLVTIKHKGDGNYRWSSEKQPSGSIVFYHAIPNNIQSQRKLDSLNEGDSVTILAKVSKNSEIKASNGTFFKLLHTNHKIILVEDL